MTFIRGEYRIPMPGRRLSDEPISGADLLEHLTAEGRTTLLTGLENLRTGRMLLDTGEEWDAAAFRLSRTVAPPLTTNAWTTLFSFAIEGAALPDAEITEAAGPELTASLLRCKKNCRTVEIQT